MSTVEAPIQTRVDAASENVGEPRREPRLLLPGLLCLFFLTGACGLVYQQLWARLLSLVFGVTVYAVATVLASFFAGLALGSVLAGRIVDRTDRPLRWYGILEILVGATALVTAPAIGIVERIYVGVVGTVPDSVPLLTGVRLALSLAVFIVPATLMGASLPIVIRSSAARSSRLGERIGLLYAMNTAGAIAGTLAAGYWLIGTIGLTASFRLAAAVNLGVGAIAIVWSGRVERAPQTVPRPPSRPPDTPVVAPALVVPARARRAVLVVFGISGFVALGLEIVWFRILVLYLESTTSAFTIMLATVLFGIAAGSALVAPVLRRRFDWLLILAVTEVVLAIVTLASLESLAQGYGLIDQSGLTDHAVRPTFVVSALLILPTSVTMGMAFPIGMGLWVNDRNDAAGRRAGMFYAVNVGGGILGSLTVGFLLLPAFGTRASVTVLCLLLLGCGVVLALWIMNARARVAFIAAAVAAFVVVAVVAVPDPYDAVLHHRYPGERVLWQDEGIDTTVSVHERTDGTRVMYLDALHQANDSPPMVAFHGLIGTLPMALHPDPERALVIGLGGGVTAGAVSVHDDVAVDVIELSTSVVDGAEWFAHVNHDVVNRPNVDVKVDDGRNHLLVTDRRYDVVTADVIQPRHAGAGKLWSVEYWELARDALADDGIVLQWIPTEHAADYERIMRSFLDVFPNATLWSDGSLLVGTRDPLRLERADLERRLADAETRAALATAGITSFETLLGLYTAGPDEMRAFVGDGPVLTDDRPALEFSHDADHDDPPDLGRLRGNVDDVVAA